MGGVALNRDEILGVILAGGQSRRFGADKAVTPLGHMRLIEHVMRRAMPQVGALAVSGRDYGLGLPVIDDHAGSEGPLSGILSALLWARTKGFSAIATFSCDAPFFPYNLVERLAQRTGPGRSCSFVRDGNGRHPVFAVWRVESVEALADLYREGVRALKAAQDCLGGTGVIFPDGPAPGGDMFFNINRPDDRLVADRWLAGRSSGDIKENSGGPSFRAAYPAISQV